VRGAPARAVGTRHEPRVRGELVARAEARDRADLGVEHQRAERPHPGERLQLPGDGIPVGGPLDPVIERLNLLRQRVDEAEQHVDLLAQRRRERHACQPGAAGLAIEVRRQAEVVFGDEMAMSAVLQLRALPHEEGPAAEQLPARAGRGVGDPDRGQQNSSAAVRRACGRRSDRSSSGPAK